MKVKTSNKRKALKCDLTIGMIVKNEEKYLEQCLKALQPLKEHLECEIIVTDTGSTDRTVEIAEQYADKVLHFEWCNDFAKARNTGVKISQGAWFMFIDADEIFEDSVIEIAQFIKSEDRDKYDCATYMIKNYKNNECTRFNYTNAVRLFNFKKGLRFFEGEVHEHIPYSDSIFNIKSALLHYGYLPEILEDKLQRNKVISESQYAKSPKNIGLINNLFSVANGDEKVEWANKAFDLIDKGSSSNYKSLVDKEFVFTLYCDLSRYYLQTKKFDLAIETCERYFNTKFIKQYLGSPNIPTQEVLYTYGFAFYQKKDFDNALKKLVEYQEMYEALQINHNTFNQSACVYRYNNELEYERAGYLIMTACGKLGDEQKYLKYLTKSKMYKFALEDEISINEYVKNIISYNQVNLFQKVLSYYKDKNLDIKFEKITSVLVAKLFFYSDLSYFLNNHDVLHLNKALTWGYRNTPDIRDVLYNIMSNDLDVNSIKEMKIYIQVAHFYLNSEIGNLAVNDTDLNLREKIDDIFTFYVESMMCYLNEVYQSSVLDESNIDMLTKEEGMCIIINSAFENRETNQVEFIKSLKEALIYNADFKHIILNCIFIIERQISKNEEKPKNSEFDDLAKKIKQTISTLIENKELDQAKALIEQYKGINPNDSDIEKFIV